MELFTYDIVTSPSFRESNARAFEKLTIRNMRCLRITKIKRRIQMNEAFSSTD